MSWSWIWFLLLVITAISYARYERRVQRLNEWMGVCLNSMSAVAAHRRDTKKVTAMYVENLAYFADAIEYPKQVNELLKASGLPDRIGPHETITKQERPELLDTLSERLAVFIETSVRHIESQRSDGQDEEC